jgi:hypothetical protein
MNFDFEEKFYEENPCQILPENLSPEDLEDVQDFLNDFDRTEMIEEYIVSKFSNRGEF